jgi:hypothetical protein
MPMERQNEGVKNYQFAEEKDINLRLSPKERCDKYSNKSAEDMVSEVQGRNEAASGEIRRSWRKESRNSARNIF